MGLFKHKSVGLGIQSPPSQPEAVSKDSPAYIAAMAASLMYRRSNESTRLKLASSKPLAPLPQSRYSHSPSPKPTLPHREPGITIAKPRSTAQPHPILASAAIGPSTVAPAPTIPRARVPFPVQSTSGEETLFLSDSPSSSSLGAPMVSNSGQGSAPTRPHEGRSTLALPVTGSLTNPKQPRLLPHQPEAPRPLSLSQRRSFVGSVPSAATLAINNPSLVTLGVMKEPMGAMVTTPECVPPWSGFGMPSPGVSLCLTLSSDQQEYFKVHGHRDTALNSEEGDSLIAVDASRAPLASPRVPRSQDRLKVPRLVSRGLSPLCASTSRSSSKVRVEGKPSLEPVRGRRSIDLTKEGRYRSPGDTGVTSDVMRRQTLRTRRYEPPRLRSEASSVILVGGIPPYTQSSGDELFQPPGVPLGRTPPPFRISSGSSSEFRPPDSASEASLGSINSDPPEAEAMASEFIVPIETLTHPVRKPGRKPPLLGDSLFDTSDDPQRGVGATQSLQSHTSGSRASLDALTHPSTTSLTRKLQSGRNDRSSTPQPLPVQFKTTLRKEKTRKKTFNEDKPWKHHKDTSRLTDQERKRYEGVWVTNKGLYTDLLTQPLHPTSLMEDHSVAAATYAAGALVEDSHSLMLGVVVRDLWDRSRLPSDVLKRIWDLVDTRHDGCLGRESFIVGMWLVDQCLYGRKLPKTVPEEVWNSVRRMNVNVVIKKKGGKIKAGG